MLNKYAQSIRSSCQHNIRSLYFKVMWHVGNVFVFGYACELLRYVRITVFCLGRLRLLRSELLGLRSPVIGEKADGDKILRTPENQNLLRYKKTIHASLDDAFSLTPVPLQNSKLFNQPRKIPRKISKVPFKVLDAPQLQDDFYLNLVDCLHGISHRKSVIIWLTIHVRVIYISDFLPPIKEILQ